MSPFFSADAPEPESPSVRTVASEPTVHVHEVPSSLFTVTRSPSTFSTVPRCQTLTIHLPVSWSFTVASPCAASPRPKPNPNRWPPRPCPSSGPFDGDEADGDAEGEPSDEPPEVAA